MSIADDASIGERFMEREHVPHEKEFHMSTRENSEYKWYQHHKDIIGALEIESEPDLYLRKPFSELTRHDTNPPHTDEFQKALQVYHDELNLHTDFVSAAEAFPPEMSCCGLIQNDKKTIRKMVPHLNETWIKDANTKLQSKSLKIDCFIWRWSHISGPSESYILLIRFHKLSEAS